MKYFLGIDVGTYESKGVLVDEKGKIISSKSISHELENPKPNYFEHDANKVWYNDVCIISKAILSDSSVSPEDIKCVGMSGLSSDCLPVDKDGNPLRKAILYGIDARAVKEMEVLTKIWGEKFIKKTFGRPLVSSDVAPKILWIKNNEPEVYKKTHKFLTASSYLAFKLTGEYTIDRFLGLASFKPLYNDDGSVNEKMCEGICHKNQLAKVMPTTTIAGYVTEEASSQTGLAEGTPVIAGGDDSGAEAISCGVMTVGDMLLQIGSTAYMILLTDKLYDDDRIWRESFIIPGSFDVSAGTNTTGSLTKWIRDNLYFDYFELEKNGGKNTYEVMMKKMRQIPIGSEGLVTLPYFAGERTPINDPNAKGVIFGLQLHHTRDHILRSAFEGICYSIKHHFEIFHEMGIHINRVMITGGGVKNPVWMQMLSDVTGVTLTTPLVTIGASYGDALMSMIGVNHKKDFESLRELIQVGKTYTPNPENTDKYKQYYDIFISLYEKNKNLMKEIG